MRSRLVSALIMFAAALVFLFSAIKAGRTMYYVIAVLFLMSGLLDLKHYFDQKRQDKE